MRFWSLGFLAIAVLAAVLIFREDGEAIILARVLFGVALLLFVISLFSNHRDHGRGGHHHR